MCPIFSEFIICTTIHRHDIKTSTEDTWTGTGDNTCFGAIGNNYSNGELVNSYKIAVKVRLIRVRSVGEKIPWSMLVLIDESNSAFSVFTGGAAKANVATPLSATETWHFWRQRLRIWRLLRNILEYEKIENIIRHFMILAWTERKSVEVSFE